MHYCGIDIAKRRHEACVLDRDGDQVFGRSIRNNQSDAELFMRQLSEKLCVVPDYIQFVMEATDVQFLVDAGYDVRVIKPIQSDVLRGLYIRETKTDVRDCLILADMLRLNRASNSRKLDNELVRLQTSERFRFELVSQIGALKQRIIGILNRVFPKYETLFSDIFIRTSRAWLSRFATPEELAAVLDSAFRGRFATAKARQIQDLARNSFAITMGIDNLAMQLKMLLAQIDFIEGQVKAIDQAIDVPIAEVYTASSDVEYSGTESAYRHVLETIPGADPVVVATLLGEIPNIKEFRTARQFVAFIGLDTSVQDSGEFHGTRMHMSKRGCAYLRRALWYCAQAAKRCDNRFSEFCERKLAESKHTKVATVDLMRKLAVTVFHF